MRKLVLAVLATSAMAAVQAATRHLMTAETPAIAARFHDATSNAVDSDNRSQ